MESKIGLDSSPPKVRKIRKDRRYPDNKSRQRAYRSRLKALDDSIQFEEILADLDFEEGIEE